MDYNKLLYSLKVRNLAHQLMLTKHPEASEFKAGSEHYVNFMKAALAEVEAATQFIEEEARTKAGRASSGPLRM